ncbi:MAG: hypothetical protein JXB30_01820 [Anaerolineae bacterium]|nr:hypothetical protein [Anaerolineae bacterium]
MQWVTIRVREHLDEQWAEWLDGFTITHTQQNETVLSGPIADQSALYGLMGKLRDLGVVLLSVDYGEQPSHKA